MRLEARVGTIDADAGSINPLRTATDGSLIIRMGGGRHVQAALEGRLFSIANQGGVTTTAATATPWTGLGLCNPTGSGKNLIVYEFGWAVDSFGDDDGIVGLMSTDDTAFTASLTPKAAMNGRGSSVAYCDAAVAIPAAGVTLERICGSHGRPANSAVQISVPQSIYRVDGSIILPPGRSILSYTTTVYTTTIVFHFLWEEVDI